MSVIESQNPLTKLTKNRAGRIVMIAAAGAPKVGNVYRVRPDFAFHSCNEARYDFRVTGLGEAFTRVDDIGYYDDINVNTEEGFRKTGTVSNRLQYAYGEIVARQGETKW